MTTQDAFVIVGAGLAGAKAAETLRGEGFDGRVVLVGAERELPYEQPPLSKGYLGGTASRESAAVHEKGWYEEHDVDLRVGVLATGLDPAAHRLTLDTGEELSYARLLLATGSSARRLSLPGADLDGVRYLRTLPDADRLLGDLSGGGAPLLAGRGPGGRRVPAPPPRRRPSARLSPGGGGGGRHGGGGVDRPRGRRARPPVRQRGHRRGAPADPAARRPGAGHGRHL